MTIISSSFSKVSAGVLAGALFTLSGCSNYLICTRKPAPPGDLPQTQEEAAPRSEGIFIPAFRLDQASGGGAGNSEPGKVYRVPDLSAACEIDNGFLNKCGSRRKALRSKNDLLACLAVTSEETAQLMLQGYVTHSRSPASQKAPCPECTSRVPGTDHGSSGDQINLAFDLRRPAGSESDESSEASTKTTIVYYPVELTSRNPWPGGPAFLPYACPLLPPGEIDASGEIKVVHQIKEGSFPTEITLRPDGELAAKFSGTFTQSGGGGADTGAAKPMENHIYNLMAPPVSKTEEPLEVETFEVELGQTGEATEIHVEFRGDHGRLGAVEVLRIGSMAAGCRALKKISELRPLKADCLHGELEAVCCQDGKTCETNQKRFCDQVAGAACSSLHFTRQASNSLSIDLQDQESLPQYILIENLETWSKADEPEVSVPSGSSPETAGKKTPAAAEKKQAAKRIVSATKLIRLDPACE